MGQTRKKVNRPGDKKTAEVHKRPHPQLPRDCLRLHPQGSNFHLYVFIDASFATHTDCTLGIGAFYTKSTSQKINTTSSCEAELVALAKGLQQSLWSRTFLAGQGFDTPAITVNQDNQSTIKLIERAGAPPRSSPTISISDTSGSTISSSAASSTSSFALADHFTKPLQGSLFADLRDQVLGAKAIVLF